jgi:hypothetical protein
VGLHASMLVRLPDGSNDELPTIPAVLEWRTPPVHEATNIYIDKASGVKASRSQLDLLGEETS